MRGLPIAIALAAGVGFAAVSWPLQGNQVLGAGGAAATADAIHGLRAALDALVAHPARAQAAWGVLAVSLDSGDTLYAFNPSQPLAPASNMKLLTTAAALNYLGPEYRFQTFLLTDGRVSGGVLHGNVYLYGTGDPTLGKRYDQNPAAALRAFADTLVALGVREIRGDVIGDGSYFQGDGSGEGWMATYLPSWFAAPAGALSVHENLVRLIVRPGNAPGARPKVEYVPGGRGIAVVNLATTGGGGRIRVRRFDFDAPILIEGAISSGESIHDVPVGDPARYAAAIFRDHLEARGIVVDGGLRVIRTTEASPVSGRRIHAPAFDDGPGILVLAVHASPRLRDILLVINHESHNFYADQVFRSVGRVAAGEGSVRGGEQAVRRLLAGTNADTAGLVMMDGCGLSPLNRVSPGTFVALLDRMAKSGWGEEFQRLLPIAGRTERFRRMGGTVAEGNLRAKTGTIDAVSALAGYVNTADGELVAFSIMSNGVGSTANSKHVENLIGIQLAEFSRSATRVAADSVSQVPASPAPTVPAH